MHVGPRKLKPKRRGLGDEVIRGHSTASPMHTNTDGMLGLHIAYNMYLNVLFLTGLCK